MTGTVVETKDLKKYFPIKSGLFGKVVAEVRAVDGVTMKIHRGEVFALVGESGCGKTTLGRLLLGLTNATGGQVILNFVPGKKAVNLKRKLRDKIQIVFQDPYASLNPRMLIKDLVAEPLKRRGYKGKELSKQILDLLSTVGLEEQHLYRYPHELSGGQLQRVCIARALAVKPEFIVLDEPTSNLDVSVQAQILNLLKDLQRNLNLTYLLITHDVSVVYYMAQTIAVMYLGKIVEIAEKDGVFKNPLHPYTQALLSCVPRVDPVLKIMGKAELPRGDVPSSIEPPLGCRFHPRCRFAFEKCGWEPRDLIRFLHENLSLSENQKLNFERDKFSLKILSTDGGLNDKILNLVKDKKAEFPMLKAIRDIRKEDGSLFVEFSEVSEPELISVDRDHEVACLLYEAS